MSVPGIRGVEWVISRVALTKESVTVPHLDDRLAVLEQVAASRDWLTIAVTDGQLIAEIATDYAAVILGADKWNQIHDIAFYGHDPDRRDRAVESLPRPLLVPRAGHRLPGDYDVEVLNVAAEHHDVSSTRARSGDHTLMLDEARAFDAATGAWTDQVRYLAPSLRRASPSTDTHNPRGVQK